jgi:hypothetical protein
MAFDNPLTLQSIISHKQIADRILDNLKANF